MERESERRTNPEKRPGVTINRRDLISVPVPDAKLLWRDRRVQAARKPDGGKIYIDIIVEGVTAEKRWECGLEFYYANPESFYCRPLRLSETERMPVPDAAGHIDVAFLPPMSGLASNETRLDPGAINVRIGEGRTAEVLRNLCYQVAVERQNGETWETLCEQIQKLFGIQLDKPDYILERGEIAMRYKDQGGISLDLSSSGRGLQQTLLLLAYIAAHPGSVLLLDEPDAHLEILRQRQIYQTLTELATEHNSQIIAASHSEVILKEAAARDVVIAFLGKPHRIDDRGSHLRKSLKDIGFENYYQAELRGWVLYLEGATDLAILKAFAEKLAHPVQAALESLFVEYVGNQPQKARNHFRALQEAKPDLVGFCLFDRLDSKLQDTPELREYAWKRREIENYLCYKEVLLAWARETAEQRHGGALFSGHWENTMEESISEIESALVTLGKGSPWSSDAKVSNDFLEPLFEAFFKKLGMDNLMRKTNYHRLVHYVSADVIALEVSEVLDRILAVATQAVPLI